MNLKKKIPALLTLFKALGEPNRMSIFGYLCQERTEGITYSMVKDISSCCDLDISVVSRHLSTMRRAGVLRATKKGRQKLYSIDSKAIASMLREFANYLETECCVETEDER